MHVLTKLFVVLVSLLSVLLVPLVVVYATNEDSFKAKYEASSAQATVAASSLAAAESRHAASESRLEQRLADSSREIRTLQDQLAQKEDTVNDLQRRLAGAESLQQEIDSKLVTLATSVDAGQQLTGELITELRDLRTEMVQKERQLVELDEALRDRTGQLEVAEAAVRALREELQRMTEQHARALNTVQEVVARFGALGDDQRSEDPLSIPPDVDLTASVIRVRRDGNQVLAEIDAGSRDGVKEGWSMTIGHEGEFVANLRITRVDINRSTGVVTLEDPKLRVAVNMTAHAFSGQK